MPALVLPISLDLDFSVCLQALVRTAAQSDPSAALKTAMDDPAVHTLVLALRLGEPPVAMLASCLTAPDALVQWRDLSCI